MKKLSLKNLKLDGNDLLQREQLKTVFGGYGGEDGFTWCYCVGFNFEAFVQPQPENCYTECTSLCDTMWPNYTAECRVGQGSSF